MRVVIAHDFAETYGGAERIAAHIAGLFPDAPFWAILGRREVAARMGVADRFHSILPERPRLLRGYRALAPIYPALVAARRLQEADLLITSSYAFAHGFQTENRAPQLCYCYSPLRFAWSMTDEYAGRLPGGKLGAGALRGLAGMMRGFDRRAASRVTSYVAESHYVANQLESHYGRRVGVIWPPVDCRRFRPPDEPGHDDFFLFSGRLIEPYKRPGLAIEAFRGLQHKLVVAGDGPAFKDLKNVAGPNVEFVGHLEDEDLVALMQRCAALVFPSQDDFGLVPVEVMACGRPVVAYAAGGALETVVAGKTGEFFPRQEVGSLRSAIVNFDPAAYDSGEIRAHAERWRVERFEAELRAAALATVRR